MKGAPAGASAGQPSPYAPAAEGADSTQARKGNWVAAVALLLAGVWCFAVYIGPFAYVIELGRDHPYTFFLFGREFLAGCLEHPGGLLFPYATSFLGQFYRYTPLGAAVVSFLVVCFGMVFHFVLRRLTHRTALFCTLFPCVVLATTCGWRIIDFTLGLIVCAVAFLVYLRLANGARRIAYTLLAMPALYFLAGGYSWFFALWVIASEWLGSRPSAKLVPKVLYPALAIAMPIAAWRWLFWISLRSAFAYPLVLTSDFGYPLFLFAAFMALMPFWARIPGPAAWGAFFAGSKRRLAFGAALLAVLAAALLWKSYDPAQREFAEFDRLYKRQQWDAILERAARHPSSELMVQFFTNYALYHKGKLLDEMFHYPQPWGTRGLILYDPAFYAKPGSPKDDVPRAMYYSDLFFEMGHMSEAFVAAYVHVNMIGMTYAGLRRMAECSMASGNYPLARTYLNVLERSLFDRAFARHCKDVLADADAAGRCFAESRSRQPTLDPNPLIAPFVAPLVLLKSNAHNRMAFDYLVAWCLLDKTSIVMLPDYIGCLREAGYASVPTHLQEALMMRGKAAGGAADMKGFEYAEGTAQRFDEFARRVRQYSSMSAAAEALRPAFGDTYMYYAAFATPPLVQDHASEQVRVGDEFRSLGRTEEAIAEYRHALELDSKSSDAHTGLGDALASLGRVEEAAAEYREAARKREGGGAKATPPAAPRQESRPE